MENLNIGTFIFNIWKAVTNLVENLLDVVGDWEGSTWLALLGGVFIIGLIIASIIRG